MGIPQSFRYATAGGIVTLLVEISKNNTLCKEKTNNIDNTQNITLSYTINDEQNNTLAISKENIIFENNTEIIRYVKLPDALSQGYYTVNVMYEEDELGISSSNDFEVSYICITCMKVESYILFGLLLFAFAASIYYLTKISITAKLKDRNLREKHVKIN
ncbi:MAG: hypothetical protein PHU12_01295 [Candidatus Aenigmarchaeota archaeon]|nr:hypothetical protein [Candidatus Aenigmarchaeota archaeon]